jgi:hypothetical protein
MSISIAAWEHEGYKLSTSGSPLSFHVIRPDGQAADVNIYEYERATHPGASLLTLVIGRANRKIAIKAEVALLRRRG